ncbi:NACHT domain-containing protein [Paraburkholderia sp. NPDC080076]|uniref:NACHT domain-containing protein n=1 Tax=Paraburkholderia sp. NPDC080076 TaxID=3390605 RepID=UPI003D06C8E5
MTEDIFIQRSATLKKSDSGSDSRLLSDWEFLDAYVLLGEPGAGKTTAFKAEAERMGEAAYYVTARDFAVLKLPVDARGKTMFIDSLDERRTDSVSPFTALDEIRKALQEAGCPRFRLSCREADWVQKGDSDLGKVSPSKKVETLWLNPLNEAEILEVLGRMPSSKAIEPVAFLQEAKVRKLDPLLSNPLFLKLLADVVQKDDWPESRSDTYAAACKLLVREHNRAHQVSRPIRNSINSERLLSAAGKLAAVMLLSNCSEIHIGAVDTAAADAFHIDDLPSDLNVDKAIAMAALDTKLFSAEGDSRVPVHRTVGEYLAGRAIGDLVSNHGLPLQRVLAIMSLAGTQTVDVLRGVHAWLTLFCVKDTDVLIANDPLGLVLYGDVKPFSVGQKTKLLFELQRAATENPWFRNENWEAHPFGALGTADMGPTFARFLQNASRDMGHEALVVCILDAIRFGDTIPGLAGIFEEIARDETRAQRVRFGAVAAWLRDGSFELDPARRLLSDVSSGAVKDPDDEVLGKLLDCLYPTHLSVREVFACCRPPKRPNLIGQFRMFWAVEFNRILPNKDLTAALETLDEILMAPAARNDIDTPTRAYDMTREVAAKVLMRAVEVEGEAIAAAQLWEWFSLGLDKYGSAGLESSTIQFLSDWLSHRPEMQRRLVSEGVRRMSDNATTMDIHNVENRLYDASRPADWYRWLLELASASSDEVFVQYCVDRAAFAAVNLTERFDITLEALENWIEANQQRWPQAQQWVERNTAWRLDSWQRRQFEHKHQVESRRQQERAERQNNFGERLRGLLTGARDDWLVQQIALAYDKMFSNIEGETPLQRVAELLVVDDDVAKQAIDAVKRLVTADYLPLLSSIISVGRKAGQTYTLSYPALLAARLCFAGGDDVKSWKPSVVEALLGFYMVDAGAPMPDWMRAIAEDNPGSLSNLMLTCWEAQLNDGRAPNVDALQFLRDEDAPKGLVEDLLPRVLNTIAADPDERILHFFNAVLLTGAERHLRPDAISGALKHLLSRSGTSDKFQLALRMGLFVTDPQSQIDAIETDASKRPDGTYLLAKAFEQRGQGAYDALALHPAIAARMIRVLASAPSIRTPSDDESYDSPYNHQSAVLQRIAHLLAASLSPDAEQALRELRQDPALELWRSWLGALYFQRDRKVKNQQYVPPMPVEVLNVLANKAPANSRDMAELLRDHLSHVAQRIHFEETNLLDLFYDRDEKGVLTPKSENSCRDVLLGLLRDSLALRSVQIEKESLAAAEKRADMQATIFAQSGRRILPVEIKKDNHKELWYAWRDQLEPRYMRNPSAEGVGVFVILWFGHKTKVGPDGRKPKSAQQLAEMMSALIPAEYVGHIVGLVVDLSRGLSRG